MDSPPTRLFIRPQVPQDAPAIEALQRRTYVEAFGQLDALEPDIERNTRYLVAELGGQMIGCIGAVVPGSPRFYFERLVEFGDPRLPKAATRANTSETDGLVIAPKYARRGFGRLLLCALVLEMEAMGAAFSIGLSSDSARRMVRQAGGQLTGERFEVGNSNEELGFTSIPASAKQARMWLGRAVQAGMLDLSEALAWRLEPLRGVG